MVQGCDQAGSSVGKLLMIGGGTKSSLWPKKVADVCNVHVELPQRQEAACACAAVLAASGCQLYSSIEEGSRRFRDESLLLQPSKKNVELYREGYFTFLDRV